MLILCSSISNNSFIDVATARLLTSPAGFGPILEGMLERGQTTKGSERSFKSLI